MAMISKLMGASVASLSKIVGALKTSLYYVMGLDLRPPPENVLDLVGLGSIAGDCLYMFYPAERSRGAADKHYLYTGGSWQDPEVLDTTLGDMNGTMTADGTGGSLSYTPEIVAPTIMEGISILYTNANIVVPILSMGFNRSLTAGERTTLAGLITPVAAAAGVAAGSCSLITGQEFQQKCLKMRVNTTLAGSANDTFILPADGAGSYAYTVDWGNGSRAYVTANTSQTKDYDATAIFIVKVYGTYRPYFNNAGDKAKLTRLQIGATLGTTLKSAWWGCTALTSIVGYADTSAVTDFSSAWRGCTSLTSFPAINTGAGIDFSYTWAICVGLASFPTIDTSKGTSFKLAWYNCINFTSFPVLNVSEGTDFSSAWASCSAMKASFAAFDITKATNVTDMFDGCNINATGTSTNYDATLVAWELLDLTNSLSFNGGTSKYSDTGQTARTAIATDDLWTFTDGGHI